MVDNVFKRATSQNQLFSRLLSGLAGANSGDIQDLAHVSHSKP